MAVVTLLLGGCVKTGDPEPGDTVQDCSIAEQGSPIWEDCEDFNDQVRAMQKSGGKKKIARPKSLPNESCSIKPDPTTKNGCITPRTLPLVQKSKEAGYPNAHCWQPGEYDHPKGRACDFMMTSGGPATGEAKARGQRLADWAVNNAPALGISYVIWYERVWTQARGWRDYKNPDPKKRSSPGGKHTNHVHLSVF